MSGEKPKKVACVYIGPLKSRGRLLKQIATLQSAGVSCEVYHGNTDGEVIEEDDYPFPVHSIPVDINSSKLKSFLGPFLFARKAAPLIALGPFDTVLCLTLGAAVTGMQAKKRRPALSIIFDNNEMHIESMGTKLKQTLWRPLYRKAINVCDFIIHAEVNRKNYIENHYSYDKNKPVFVLENFPNYIGQPSDRGEPKEPVRIIYLGGFGGNRFTEEIVDIFSQLDGVASLDIVGFGKPSYVEAIKQRVCDTGSRNVRILPPVPYREIPNLLTSYDIGVALYRNTNLNNYYCAPNKVYDYLMNGMPVISNNYPGLVNILEKNLVGACVEDVTLPAVKKAIGQIVDEKRWQNITDDLRRRYSWEEQEISYLKSLGLS